MAAASSSTKAQRIAEEGENDEMVTPTAQNVPELGEYMVLCGYRSVNCITQVSEIAIGAIGAIEHHHLLEQMAAVSLKEPKGAKVSVNGDAKSMNNPMKWIEAHCEKHDCTPAFAGDESKELHRQ